jgi:DSF synthase
MNAMVEPLSVFANDVDFVCVDFNADQFGWIKSRFDPEYRTLWSSMQPDGRPCFTRRLLHDIAVHERSIERSHGKAWDGETARKIDYVVYCSDIPGVFNLGGDLALFRDLIRLQDGEALLSYAKLCIDNLYPRIHHYNLPMTTIALVQGEALGGGFECALASNVLIAERSARMGLPEVFFNLFPGMGGYSFLCRKVGPNKADEVIKSGNLYSAEELYALGLVDVVAEDGMGEAAVHEYIKAHRAKRGAYVAMQRAKERVDPITYEELIDITEIWVDAALQLTDRDLKLMERLVRKQQSLADRTPPHDARPSAALTGMARSC